MTRFLGNWEVETDIVLPDQIPFLRYEHPAATYVIFLRNITEKRHDLTYLSMQMVFDAPSLQEAKVTGEQLAKEFLDHLSFVSNLKVRLRTILQIFNWESGTGMRECLYFTPSYAHDDAPYEALQPPILETIALLEAKPINPRLRRALKWFGNGIASSYPDDQFAYFWFVIELIAQLIKSPSPIPDRCPTCREPLHCPTCDATPLHRPYPKQAIEQLFSKYVSNDPQILYQRAIDARNMLMHGDEVQSIETALAIEFPNLVDQIGRLAWIAIMNQFVPVLLNKQPIFLETNRYVHMNMSGIAHMQVGFVPNFDNPDPANFPKVQFTMTSVPRQAIDDSPPAP